MLMGCHHECNGIIKRLNLEPLKMQSKTQWYGIRFQKHFTGKLMQIFLVFQTVNHTETREDQKQNY